MDLPPEGRSYRTLVEGEYACLPEACILPWRGAHKRANPLKESRKCRLQREVLQPLWRQMKPLEGQLELEPLKGNIRHASEGACKLEQPLEDRKVLVTLEGGDIFYPPERRRPLVPSRGGYPHLNKVEPSGGTVL